jgi:hypothetical protein
MSAQEDWYKVETIKNWLATQSPGIADAPWLTQQLNAAFRKGKQMQDAALRDALALVSSDMHEAGLRPCGTCRSVSEAIGQPFGCVAYQAQRKREHHEEKDA